MKTFFRKLKQRSVSKRMDSQSAGDKTKAGCRYCKCGVRAHHAGVGTHSKTVKQGCNAARFFCTAVAIPHSYSHPMHERWCLEMWSLWLQRLKIGLVTAQKKDIAVSSFA